MPRISVLRILISISLSAALAAAGVGQKGTVEELDVVRCWAVSGEAPVSRLASDGVRLYAASDGARLNALMLDGKKVWSAEFGGEIVSNVLVADTSVYLATNASGETGNSFLRILSRETGIVAGTIPLPAADRHFIYHLNGRIVVVSSNGVVHLLDEKGVVKWRREIATGFAGIPAFGSDRLYVASTTNQVFTIHLADGEIESVRKMPFNVTAVGVTPAGMLVVGDERGSLTLLTADGRTHWRFRSGARISRIFADKGHVLALSHDNFVYRIDMSSGSVTWKRRLGGRAVHSATINGSYTLTTSLDEHGAVLTGLESGKPAGQVVLSEDEFVSSDPVAAGPLVLIGTNTAVYGYSLSGQAGCPK